MNSKYTGKLVEHLLDKISSLSSGDVGDFIGTGLLDKFLRKDLDERTPHSLASDKKLEVGNFVSGTAGAVIYIDELTKHSVAEIDKLYVRLKAYFEQLEIINVNSVGGKLIISPAGGIKCSLVETYDSWGYYRCYFLSEQDGEKIENRFAVGDLAYSKTFNAREGSYNKISNRYYYRLVVGAGENYIDLSKTDCDADSDEPQEGDVIVHRGNRNDVDRLNCLEFSSVDSFSPSITLYQGINDYSLADKNVIQFGVEKSTGKAFMNVYGDMFVGNRDNSSYIRYSPEKGVEIKGKLDIGTSFGDKTLLDAIDLASTAYEEDLNNLKDIVNRDILNILNLLDGAIETWFYDPAPTLTNLPASLWTTEADKNVHLGDLYYSGAGRAYRFLYDADNSLYYWQEIVDTDIVLALENAKKAQDTADSKRKIFARKPENSDSYDIGDMWVNANYTDNNVTYKDDLLRAIVTKNAGELFKIEHWTLASKYTDDTVAKDALEKATNAQLTVNTLLSDVTSFKGYVDGAFLDGIIDSSEAQAIEKYINQLNTIKQQVDKSYEEIIKNSILENTTYLTNLNDSYSAFSTSYNELIDTINAAISDNKTTDLEKSAVDSKYSTFNDKYRDYTAYLNLAINYIEETINGKVERALLDIGGYKYLKAALLENTSIEGGLIQSSMLSLGYTKNNLFLVMAGTNGLVLDKGDRTIASWFGGGMVDMFDYYDSNTKTFNVPKDVRAAAGLDRMDGTGYRAKGNLWWDETGIIHADPLSFFVGEATVGGLLASFLVVMKDDGKHPLYLIPQVPFLSLEIADYIRIGDALLKYDSTNKAIYVTSADGTTSMGFYASGYVSALGKSSSTGGGGGASALYQLVDVLANSTNDGVLNAINGSVLMYNGSKWQAGNVITDISPLVLNVNGSNLFTYDGKSSITANLTVPTKVSQLTNDSGYLTAITKAQVEGVLTGNITSHTHSYLPLSGGTLSGNLTVGTTATTGNFEIGVYRNANKAAIGVSNNCAYLSLYSSDGSVGAVYVNSTKLQYRKGSTWYDIWHSDNFNPSNYLPLSGGTIQSTTWNPLIINTTYSSLGFYLHINSVSKAGLVYNSNGASVYNATNNTYLGIKDDGTPHYQGNTLLHSGNYNSYAPTLTGAGVSGTWGISITGNASTTTKLQTPRTIWGESFDGTANVNGDLTGVTNLTASGYVSDAGLGYFSNRIQGIGWHTVARISKYYYNSADIYISNAYYYHPTQGLHIRIAKGVIEVLSSGITTITKVRCVDEDVDIYYSVENSDVFYWRVIGNGCVTTDGSISTKTGGDECEVNVGVSINSNLAVSGNTTIAGNVGIGTTSPSYKLHIVGDIYTTTGFKKNGSSDSYVLLGGGGHKAESSLSVNYAASAGSATTSTYATNSTYLYASDSPYRYGDSSPYYMKMRYNVNNDSRWYLSAYPETPKSIAVDYSYTSGTAAAAIKFKTARTIWGQSFDGTGDIAISKIAKMPYVLFKNYNDDNSAGYCGRGASNRNQIYLTAYSGNAVGIGANDTDNVLYINTYLNVGIGTTSPSVKLHVIGDIAATGAVTAKASSSDIRLKTDISDYKALSIIRNHRSIKYHWNEVAKANADIFNDDYWHYGLIAQELQKDLPQMVSDIFKDYLVINYERLIPICWKGLQEVDDEVTKLKKKVRKLEMEIRELKQKEDRL